MKKKKFSLLLNIATICLCVCAIAIGVYSAKTASLSISGSIGFEAHNCIVEISGSYSACSSVTATSRTTTSLTTTTVGGTESATGKIENLSLFFSDYATDGDEIVFNLTITNKSDFKITVTAPAPTLKNASEQDISGVTCTSSEEKFTLEAKDQTGASKTITLTYKLEDIDNATNITDGKFSITLNFEKRQQFYTDSVTELFTNATSPIWNEVTTTKLCTTMGHSIVGTTAGTDGETEIPIQWYAFAVRGEETSTNNYNTKPTSIFGTKTPLSITNSYTSGSTTINETWYSLYGVDMSKVDYKGHTFWFIQQYVTAGGYYMGNSDDTHRDGVQFDSTNNYSASDIYTSLTTETDGTYLSSTGIKDDGLYASVATRNVNESYSVTFSADYVTNGTYTSTFSSKLWLISTSELGLITNKDTDITKTGYKYGTKTAGIGSQDLSKNYNNYGANWWLRSPNSSDRISARWTSNDGYFGSYLVDLSSGVRAAFQISI